MRVRDQSDGKLMRMTHVLWCQGLYFERCSWLVESTLSVNRLIAFNNSVCIPGRQDSSLEVRVHPWNQVTLAE